MKRLSSCFALLLALAGCAQSPPQEAAREIPREAAKETVKEVPRDAVQDRPVPVAARPAAVPPNELLAFARRYGEMSAENQKKEYAQVTQALGRNKGDLSARMKAALLLGLPSSRFRDDARALALLDEVLRDKKADADSRALAGLLKDYLGERQKLEDSIAKADQKAAEEQKRADDLQQKLDELKNIEKTLTERKQAVPK